MNRPPKPNGPAFDHIRFRIHRRTYSSIRTIMAESGESDTELKMGLARLHGIKFSGPLDEDRILFFTEDEHQLEGFAPHTPTLMQIILTSKAFSFDEEDCKARWETAMIKLKEEE